MPMNIEVSALSGQTLLELAIKHKLPLNHSCGGMGSCGTCRVKVCSGSITLPGEVELEMINERGFEAYERLACQNEALSDLVVSLPVPYKNKT